MKTFRGLAVASAVLAFAIAILGSWVRINGAGMTCPDWPLCRGALIPSLEGGVVLEWTHRLFAFLEGFIILGAIAAGWRCRKEVAGISQTLGALAAIFVLQIALGGVTIFQANSPVSVMLHWGAAMLLLATLTVLALLALFAPSPIRGQRARGESALVPAALVVAAAFAFVTMCLGAYVSSSNYGLACSAFPACDATLLGAGPPQLLQMLHRFAAESFGVVALVATFIALGSSPRVRAFALLGMLLVLLQLFLGVANVVWQLPTMLREAHAANAVATFLAFVIAAALAVLDPYAVAHRRPQRTLGSSSVARGL
ncbi:MAG: COX15/CtaA family protein [Candidatus Baltobacteraceae bacterium]